MSKDLQNHLGLYPGPEQTAGSPTHRRMFVGPYDAQDHGFPSNGVAEAFESVDLGRITTSSGGPAATANNYTFTVDGAGAVSNQNDGYQMLTGATSGNKILVRHNRRAPASGCLGKRSVAKYRLSVNTVASSTSICGFYDNGSTDPVGTPPANGVFFVITNGAIVGRVRGASGTAADTVTLATLTDGLVAELDLKFLNTGVAATSWGEFWVNGMLTPFSAAQITQLVALTGNIYHNLHIQATSASARSLTVDFCYPTCDR